MTDIPEKALAAWLRNQHASIKKCETDAAFNLYEQNDSAAHRRLMIERAELVAGLDLNSKELVAALPEDIRDSTADALRKFANGAANALRLDSIFYMSALLYPGKHQKGEPDNLERLISSLERICFEKSGSAPV